MPRLAFAMFMKKTWMSLWQSKKLFEPENDKKMKKCTMTIKEVIRTRKWWENEEMHYDNQRSYSNQKMMRKWRNALWQSKKLFEPENDEKMKKCTMTIKEVIRTRKWWENEEMHYDNQRSYSNQKMMRKWRNALWQSKKLFEPENDEKMKKCTMTIKEVIRTRKWWENEEMHYDNQRSYSNQKMMRKWRNALWQSKKLFEPENDEKMKKCTMTIKEVIRTRKWWENEEMHYDNQRSYSNQKMMRKWRNALWQSKKLFEPENDEKMKKCTMTIKEVIRTRKWWENEEMHYDNQRSYSNQKMMRKWRNALWQSKKLFEPENDEKMKKCTMTIKEVIRTRKWWENEEMHYDNQRSYSNQKMMRKWRNALWQSKKLFEPENDEKMKKCTMTIKEVIRTRKWWENEEMHYDNQRSYSNQKMMRKWRNALWQSKKLFEPENDEKMKKCTMTIKEVIRTRKWWENEEMHYDNQRSYSNQKMMRKWRNALWQSKKLFEPENDEKMKKCTMTIKEVIRTRKWWENEEMHYDNQRSYSNQKMMRKWRNALWQSKKLFEPENDEKMKKCTMTIKEVIRTRKWWENEEMHYDNQRSYSNQKMMRKWRNALWQSKKLFEPENDEKMKKCTMTIKEVIRTRKWWENEEMHYDNQRSYSNQKMMRKWRNALWQSKKLFEPENDEKMKKCTMTIKEVIRTRKWWENEEMHYDNQRSYSNQKMMRKWRNALWQSKKLFEPENDEKMKKCTMTIKEVIRTRKWWENEEMHYDNQRSYSNQKMMRKWRNALWQSKKLFEPENDEKMKKCTMTIKEVIRTRKWWENEEMHYDNQRSYSNQKMMRKWRNAQNNTLFYVNERVMRIASWYCCQPS